MKENTIINTGKRNYGIDSLRIVSMVMVLVLHIAGLGGVLSAVESHPLQYYIVWLVRVAAFGSVDCYALISGYVGVYAKHKYSNFVTLWLNVAFYSIGITLITIFVAPSKVGKSTILSSVFPVFTNMYWYFSSYFVLFLFIPLLNHCLKSLSKRKLQIFLVLIIAAFSVVFPIASNFGGDFSLSEGYSPWWLIVLYLLGGYIRKYGLFEKIRKRFLLLLFIASVLLSYGSSLIIPSFTEIIDSRSFVKYNSITVLASAVFMLVLFSKITLNKTFSRIVAFFAPLTFSTYIIHLHPIILKYFITDGFVWIANLPFYAIVPVIFGCAIVLFIACCCIDIVRYWLFKWLKIKERLTGLEGKIKNKIGNRINY